jgi:GcrA cell cycle regulator
MIWTQQRLSYAERRWKEGASASVIAAELGDVTRSAIMGLAWRRRWPERTLTERKPYRTAEARHARRNSFWTEARDNELRDRVHRGEPALKIAVELGTSSSAVGKRARHLGIVFQERAKSPSRSTHQSPRISPPLPTDGWIPPERPLPQEAKPVTLMLRTAGQCCWIIGETCGPQTMMCGASKSVDVSYCTHHTAIAKGQSRPEWTEERRAAVARGRARAYAQRSA